MSSINRRQLRELNLVDFAAFVKDETLLINDPLSSKSVIDLYCEGSSKVSQQNLKPKKKQFNNICHHGR